MRFRIFFSVALGIAVAGCATYSPSVPAGYGGPKALLEDSARTYGSSKADFFVADELDGLKIDNSIDASFRANQGRGMAMTPAFVSRPLVAEKPVKIGIKGRTHYAAPILALTGTVYQVKGIVEFTPAIDGRYVVRGEFGKTYSAIWIEDSSTNQPVGKKIEVNGDATLGFLEK